MRKALFPIVAFMFLLLFVIARANVSGSHLIMGEHVFAVERVSTPVALERGLSGRASLPGDSAMLFVFERPGKQCFWMKDMNFALDIIWLDATKRVVYLALDISPETYPKTFCPDQDAAYVVEVNAGRAQKNGVKVGSKAEF